MWGGEANKAEITRKSRQMDTACNSCVSGGGKLRCYLRGLIYEGPGFSLQGEGSRYRMGPGILLSQTYIFMERLPIRPRMITPPASAALDFTRLI